MKFINILVFIFIITGCVDFNTSTHSGGFIYIYEENTEDLNESINELETLDINTTENNITEIENNVTDINISEDFNVSDDIGNLEIEEDNNITYNYSENDIIIEYGDFYEHIAWYIACIVYTDDSPAINIKIELISKESEFKWKTINSETNESGCSFIVLPSSSEFTIRAFSYELDEWLYYNGTIKALEENEIYQGK